MTNEQQEALITHVMNAASRARGLGVRKEDVSGRVEALRRNGESTRDWLARLDTAGELLGSSAAGYRGQTLEPNDLWSVLEDPDADPELRAGAARILKHAGQPEARLRIDAALAAVRDENASERLRISMRDDIDEASHELAALDGDPVPHMLERIQASLERFGIHFDGWARQSILEERLPQLLPRLDTYEKDGALWARSGAYGDDDDRVLIRSATGLPTYRAADVPYLVDKLERGYDKAIYVLGADHHSTARWYPAIVCRMRSRG